MKRFLGAMIVTALVSGQAGADDKDATAILDKGIKALGGEEKLAKAAALSWKSKGTITLNGEDNSISIQATAQGVDRYRSEFEGDFGGNTIKGVVILDATKGWRNFNDNVSELDADALANEKRNAYLLVVPATLVPLKGKGFKVEAAADEKVGDKAAAVLKVTGPDGKDFKLSFDKETGLPVKLTAKVMGFMGEEFTQETTFADYKDFAGIKKATKLESKRDGEKFINSTVTDFKAMDKAPAGTFDEPK